MAKLAGIFGYPLAHSISPAFQQAAFDYHSLAVTYHAWPVPPGALGEEVQKLRGDRYLGANVTVPYKERVRGYLDHVDSWAETIGAVNTISREGTRLIGSNTDAYGFIKSLKETGRFDPRGKQVLLLGAGGAARAAVFALAAEQVRSLTIANRTVGRAQSLADAVRDSVDHVQAVPLQEEVLKRSNVAPDLIVNCTSLGMRHGDAEGTTPLPTRLIPSGALVYDMVYNPVETPLLKEAKRAGARTLGGLPMLIYQGAASFERWTGQEAPVAAMFEAGRKALALLARI